MPLLAGPEQSRYVEDNQILDSIILANEVFHSLKSTKTSRMLIKLDISKAFNKFSWKYIKKIILSFGFHTSLVNWVMQLIFSTSLSILVNGSHVPYFLPSRAICQGDPLSPFIFMIMVDGLGHNIKEVVLSQRP